MRLTVLEEAIGLIAYDGPSLLNDRRVVAIVTGVARPSSNVKTGNMIQTWILLADRHPLEARKSGADAAVCGDCVHRRGSCYVALNHAPSAVWHAYRRDRYVTIEPKHRALFRRRTVRLGAYGDPAAVPTDIWRSIVRAASGHTGYTHAWRDCDQELRELCMASCETPEEAGDARAMGWKPFLVRPPGSRVPPGFFTCPASAEAGHRLTCAQCLACRGGAWNGRTGLPTIEAHGDAVKRHAIRKLIADGRLAANAEEIALAVS